MDPLNPQPRPWRSGNCHCLMPVKGRLKSRVGSNPREALFRKFRKIIKKTLTFIEKSSKIIKFHRKIIKNHQKSSKNTSNLNQILDRFSFDSRYVFEEKYLILSRKIHQKSLFVLTLPRVSLMQKGILFFEYMIR